MDLVNYVCLRAVRRFGDRGDGLFDAACFSAAWRDVTGLKSGLDGYAVEAMLHGRADVTSDGPGSAHYRLRASGLPSSADDRKDGPDGR